MISYRVLRRMCRYIALAEATCTWGIYLLTGCYVRAQDACQDICVTLHVGDCMQQEAKSVQTPV